jgi:hypothetical protein
VQAIDAGPVGKGLDQDALWVDDAALDDPALDDRVFADVTVPAADPSGFRYRCEGILVSGDFHLIRLGIQVATTAPPTR